MNLQQIIDTLHLIPLTRPIEFTSIYPTSGYTSDLLSCVMAGAKNNGIWVTLQSHVNIVAVASLLELSSIIITEGAQPDAATIAKADEQSIVLLSTSSPTFEIVGKLWEMGLTTG
jgi:hypothetical protein